MRTTRTLSLFVFLALVPACAHVTPATAVLTTGEAINAAGQQEVKTAKLFEDAWAAGAITASQYEAWIVFKGHFKKTYQLLVDAWDVAAQSMDMLAAGKIYDALGVLVGELGKFYADITAIVAQFRADSGATGAVTASQREAWARLSTSFKNTYQLIAPMDGGTP